MSLLGAGGPADRPLRLRVQTRTSGGLLHILPALRHLPLLLGDGETSLLIHIKISVAEPGPELFCLSGTGTVIKYGSGTVTVIKWNHRSSRRHRMKQIFIIEQVSRSIAASINITKARFFTNFYLKTAFYGLDTEPEPVNRNRNLS